MHLLKKKNGKKDNKTQNKIMNVEIHIHHDRLRKTLIFNIEIIQNHATIIDISVISVFQKFGEKD